MCCVVIRYLSFSRQRGMTLLSCFPVSSEPCNKTTIYNSFFGCCSVHTYLLMNEKQGVRRHALIIYFYNVLHIQKFHWTIFEVVRSLLNKNSFCANNIFLFFQLPVVDPFLEKVNISDLGEYLPFSHNKIWRWWITAQGRANVNMSFMYFWLVLKRNRLI